MPKFILYHITFFKSALYTIKDNSHVGGQWEESDAAAHSKIMCKYKGSLDEWVPRMWDLTGQGVGEKIVIGGIINFLFVKKELLSIVTIYYHCYPISEKNM